MRCAYCGKLVKKFPVIHYAKCSDCMLKEPGRVGKWTWMALGFIVGTLFGWWLG